MRLEAPICRGLLVICLALVGVTEASGITVRTPPFPQGDAKGVDQARALLVAEDWTAAESLLRQLAEGEDIDAVQARGLLGELLAQNARSMDWTSDLSVHLATGLAEEALGFLDSASSGDPENFRWVREAAGISELLGNPEGAVRRIHESWIRSPQPEAAEALLNVHLRSGNLSDAVELVATLESSAQLPAKDLLGLRFRLAVAHHEDGAMELGREFSQAGGDPWLVAFLTWEFWSQPELNLERLLAQYSRYLEDSPNIATYSYFRGATRFYAADYEGAQADLRRAVEDSKVGARANLFLGRCLVRQSQREAAQTHFEAALSADPGLQGEVVLGLLDVAAGRGRAREHSLALQTYDRVLELDPTNEWALLGRPLCFKGMGDMQAARTAYESGLERSSEHPQLLNDLALLLWGNGEAGTALGYFERAAAAGALDAAENLGVIAYTKDARFVEASDLFGQVLLRERDRPKSRFYRELSRYRAKQESTSSSGQR